MATTAPLTELQHLAQCILPYFIGYMLNWILLGVLSVQVYLYYLAFPRDKRLSKLLVLGVYALEAVQTALLARDAFTLYTFSNIADAEPDSSPGKSLYHEIPALFTMLAVPILEGIVAFIVQIFYAYRLFVLTRSKRIFFFISLGSSLQLLCASLGGVPRFSDVATHNWRFSSVLSERFAIVFVSLWGACIIFVDMSIAALMMYHLLKRDSGRRSTHTILVKLVRLAVGTGAVTTVVAMSYVICIFVPGLGNYWAVPSIILGKSYSNAMLANFNHRMEFANNHGLQTTDIHIPSSLFPTIDNSSRVHISSYRD